MKIFALPGAKPQRMIIDTHSHIYLEEFDNDIDEVIQRAQNAGVGKILLPAIDQDHHQRVLNLSAKYPQVCLPMMGLHPCSVKEDYLTELEAVKNFLQKEEFIAVGEIGLDFYWDTSYREQQYDAFRKQIEWAKERNLPVVIHSRNAIDECIEVIKEMQDGGLKGVFHCFSGTKEQAERIIETGFYLGIGGVLTFKKSGLDAVMADISLDYIVLETDAPYLAPVPFRGKRNESSYLVHIVAKLATLKQLSGVEIEKITTNNAIKLFTL